MIPVAGHYEDDVAERPQSSNLPRWCLLIGERDPSAKTYMDAETAFEAAGMMLHW